MSSYWSNVLNNRLTRRRALVATGTTAAAAAFLAACGGGSDSGTTSKQAGSTLLTTPEDTMAKAPKGGTWPSTITGDPPHFDSIGRYHTAAYAQNLMSYSVLADFKVTQVKGETYPLWGFEPEGAASWEYSGDGMQLTWKLRPGLKTDPRAPTNGRDYDSSDLEFSWKKFSSLNARRGDLLNSVNTLAPVTSVSFPDKMTMVWKLAFPSPVMMQKVNRFLMLTKEGDAGVAGGYDPLRDMRGTGPWLMTSFEPSVRVVYERNPNYWRKDLPVLDRVELTIMSDQAQREAQFRAGRIDGSSSPAAPPSIPLPEKRVDMKREFPGMQLVLDSHLPFGNGAGTWMDYRPSSPWLDVRLRRALSMLIDRNLYIDTFLNATGFMKEGIDVGEPQWHSHLNAPLKEFWLDPQKPAPQGLGEQGKWWKYDPAEARKLVQAAGKTMPFAAIMNKLAGNEYAPPYHQFAEVMGNMFNEGNIFKITLNPVDYTKEFTPKMSSTGNPKGGHDFEGLAFGSIGGVTGGYADPEATWNTHFNPGGTFYKFEENFIDQRFLDLNKRQSQEMDEKKRIDLVKETQRVLADWFPMILFPGLVKGVTLYQPWHGNAGAVVSRNNEAGGWNAHLRYRWLDKSKMPS